MVSKGGGWWLEWMNGCGKEGIWVMVAAARWGKGYGFLIFMEREDPAARCKIHIYRHLKP